jgi:RNA polymerase sigma factor (sigma-70 family)
MRTQAYKTIQSAEIPDGILANRCLLGDEHAFEGLYNRYRPMLFKFIFNILHDYELSCDILQQVFLQLYISLQTLKTNKPFKSWLFQVARNRCLDELRRKRVVHFSELDTYNEDDEVEMFSFVKDPCPLPEVIAEHHDLQDRLLSAIKSLPPKFRSVVFLRYSRQLTFPEIGRTLGMPEATAKTYFSRAKPLLQAALEPNFRIAS